MDLTNLPYNKERINLLYRGFSFTPTPAPNEVELKIDLNEFSRKLRLREFFLDTTQESKLVQNKSSFEPPNQRNQELDEIIDEIKNIKIEKRNPKDNLSKAERNALKELKENKDIVIKEADKGGAIFIMTKDQYRKMVMKHLDSEAYESVADKNIDKKVMQKLKNTQTYSNQKKSNTSRTSNTQQAISMYQQKFTKVKKLPGFSRKPCRLPENQRYTCNFIKPNCRWSKLSYTSSQHIS